MVDPAAGVAVPGAESETEFVVGNRATDGIAGFVGWSAVLRAGELRAYVLAECLQARRVRNQTDGPAFRGRAEQSSLRTAQNLDALEIEHHRHGHGPADVRVVADRRKRDVVQIHARGRLTGPRRDASDLNVG